MTSFPLFSFNYSKEELDNIGLQGATYKAIFEIKLKRKWQEILWSGYHGE